MKKATSRRDLHVFFIASPIIQIVAALTIQKLGLLKEDVLCVVLRDSDTSLIHGQKIEYTSLQIDRLLPRVCQLSFSDWLLQKKIEAHCENFYVYCTWFDRSVERLMRSPKCRGHYYMEEGQLAYYDNKEFAVDADLDYKERARRKAAGSNDYHYRSDALGYFGINARAYPGIASERKIILSDFSSLRRLYSPKLSGIRKIAIFPTPHRIDATSVEQLVDVYLEKIGPNGAIKLHPGFAVYPALAKRVKEIVIRRGFPPECICGKDVIIEMEMIHEYKELFGARSSLRVYAEIFGSDYRILELPAYNPPIN